MDRNTLKLAEEVSLKEVLGQTIKLWKRWLIIGLVLSMFLGLYKFVTTYNIYKDVEKRTEYIVKNDNKISYLTKNVEDLEYEIKKQEQYFNDSIYININPLQEKRGIVSYYISTPQTGYEFDYAEDVVHAYRNLFESGEAIAFVKENLSYSIDEKYLEEIISIKDNETDVTSNYLDITVLHSNEKNLIEIMGLIREFIDKNEISIRSQVGQYGIVMVSNSTAIVTDEDIKTKRSELETSLDTLEASLESKESQLKAAKKDYISQNSIVNDTIVFALIGFIVGVIVCCACYVAHIFLSNTVISANQLRNAARISVLGDFVKKTKLDKIECLGYKLLDEDVNVSFEDMLKIASYNIVSLSNQKSIIIVDLVEDDFSKDILERVTKFDFAKSKNFIKANKTLESFDMLERLGETPSVVFIIKKTTTKLSRLEREVDIVNRYNSEFLGVISI